MIDGPEASPLVDAWYYRLDGREHGPLTHQALSELVESSGETAAVIDVREGRTGEWMLYSTRFKLPIRKSESSAPAPLSSSPGGAKAIASVGGRSRSKLREIAGANRDIVLAASAWITINAALFLFWPRDFATERKYRGVLRWFEKEVATLRARDASPSEWGELRQRANGVLAPIVADLKSTASASRPIRQHLLWAARDQFPKIVGPESADMQKALVLYEKQMKLIDAELGAD